MIYIWTEQETGCILKIAFTLSKWPHFHLHDASMQEWLLHKKILTLISAANTQERLALMSSLCWRATVYKVTKTKSHFCYILPLWMPHLKKLMWKHPGARRMTKGPRKYAGFQNFSLVLDYVKDHVEYISKWVTRKGDVNIYIWCRLTSSYLSAACKGPYINDDQFFGLFFDLPTYLPLSDFVLI